MTSPAPTAAARLTPAVRMGLSIAVAVGLYGISFGALAVAAGLSVWQAVALSALMFLTRRVDWYTLSLPKPKERLPEDGDDGDKLRIWK